MQNTLVSGCVRARLVAAEQPLRDAVHETHPAERVDGDDGFADAAQGGVEVGPLGGEEVGVAARHRAHEQQQRDRQHRHGAGRRDRAPAVGGHALFAQRQQALFLGLHRVDLRRDRLPYGLLAILAGIGRVAFQADPQVARVFVELAAEIGERALLDGIVAREPRQRRDFLRDLGQARLEQRMVAVIMFEAQRFLQRIGLVDQVLRALHVLQHFARMDDPAPRLGRAPDAGRERGDGQQQHDDAGGCREVDVAMCSLNDHRAFASVPSPLSTGNGMMRE